MNQQTLGLLLHIAELPDMRVAGSVLVDRHNDITGALIADGFLVGDGWQKNVADDDGIHPIEFDAERGGHGYLSPSEGWTPIAPERVLLYRLALKSFLVTLLGEDLRMTGSHPRNLRDGQLFEAGTLPLHSRDRTTLWLASRLHERDALLRLKEELSNRPAEGSRLILTTTRRDLLPPDRGGPTALVSIHDVAVAGSEPLISKRALRPALTGEPSGAQTDGLWVSEDGSLLKEGNNRIVVAGAIQRALLLGLYAAYRAGELLHQRTLLDRAGSGAKDLEAAFGSRWRQLRPYVHRERGFFTLKLPD